MNSKLIIVAIAIAISLIFVFFKRKKESFKILSSEEDTLRRIKSRIESVDPIIPTLNFYVSKDESFALGKKDIHICTEGASDNFLVYIALHEVAHALIPEDSNDHSKVFSDKFNGLLKKAEEKGLYDPSEPFPKMYCKKDIRSYQ